MASSAITDPPPFIILEVCVASVQSAINAVRAGADRLELCGNLEIAGGTTPSVGLFKAVAKAVPATPITVMVRPRAGDFVYSDHEIDVMLEDIQVFKGQGARGVVIGVLTPEGQVDVERTKRLVDAALPMQVGFHRAFDTTRDPMEALDALSGIIGISRILTSGQGQKVLDGIDVIVAMHKSVRLPVEDGHRDLTILPGSGINPATIAAVLAALVPEGLREVHLSGGQWTEGQMKVRRDDLGMGIPGQEWSIWETDPTSVSKVRMILDMVCKRLRVN